MRRSLREHRATVNPKRAESCTDFVLLAVGHITGLGVIGSLAPDDRAPDECGQRPWS